MWGQQSKGLMNQNTQYGNTYNPNWKNHPKFSWGGNQSHQNCYRPQGNFNQHQNPPQQIEESTNDLLKKLLLDNQHLRTDFRNLERQMGQLVANQNTRPVGALPSDTKPNTKSQVNAVTLRNGRELEEVPEKKKYIARPKGELVPKPVEENKKEKPEIEVPKYARYLRDILTNKRRYTEFETAALTEECSARVQSKPPPKLKDPGCFTIPLSLKKQDVGRALSDLGANEEVPIIMGRPFLATGGALINVREGKLKMRVRDEKITFNVYKTLNIPKHYEDLCMTTVVELTRIKQSPYANCSNSDGTTELEEVVLQAECVRMIEKRSRDERRDLLRVCKKARLNGRKKKIKRLA
ncbi:uncharacterized protein [Nicotiana sylvestris]|uniref:uncharacterized protein n=1 Tax=Nicotiana sylvestris TaxID=4096 RepID=UPI00388C8249